MSSVIEHDNGNTIILLVHVGPEGTKVL